jgi:hypothetical protein
MQRTQWSVKIIAVVDIYKLAASVYFVCDNQSTKPPTVSVGKVVTKVDIATSISNGKSMYHRCNIKELMALPSFSVTIISSSINIL